jgi:hypothetical protein
MNVIAAPHHALPAQRQSMAGKQALLVYNRRPEKCYRAAGSLRMHRAERETISSLAIQIKGAFIITRSVILKWNLK